MRRGLGKQSQPLSPRKGINLFLKKEIQFIREEFTRHGMDDIVTLQHRNVIKDGFTVTDEADAGITPIYFFFLLPDNDAQNFSFSRSSCTLGCCGTCQNRFACAFISLSRILPHPISHRRLLTITERPYNADMLL